MQIASKLKSGSLKWEGEDTVSLCSFVPTSVFCTVYFFFFFPSIWGPLLHSKGRRWGENIGSYPRKMNYALNCKYSISSAHMKVPKEIRARDLKFSSSDIFRLRGAPRETQKSFAVKDSLVMGEPLGVNFLCFFFPLLFSVYLFSSWLTIILAFPPSQIKWFPHPYFPSGQSDVREINK